MRIAAFLAGLAALLGLAVLAGGAVGPEPSEREPAAAEERAMGAHDEEQREMSTPTTHAPKHDAAAQPRGLAIAGDGLRLALLTPELQRGRTQQLRFRVLGDHGDPVRAFDVGHERRMHAIVVRRDLSGFRHVHPRMAADGTWSVPLRLDEAGSHRVYADFTRDGEPHTLAADLRVDGDADLRPLPAPAGRAVSDVGDDVTLDASGLRANRETTLRFAVTRDGDPVALDAYLGAGGHLVALREGDMAFLHVHPVEGEAQGEPAHEDAPGTHAEPHAAPDGRVAFATTFPSAGRYRLFVQYRVGAQVRTAAFTVEVTP